MKDLHSDDQVAWRDDSAVAVVIDAGVGQSGPKTNVSADIAVRLALAESERTLLRVQSATLATLEREVADLRVALDGRIRALARAETAVAALEARLLLAEAASSDQARELDRVMSSYSMRFTAPLRRLARVLRRR